MNFTAKDDVKIKENRSNLKLYGSNKGKTGCKNTSLPIYKKDFMKSQLRTTNLHNLVSRLFLDLYKSKIENGMKY